MKTRMLVAAWMAALPSVVMGAQQKQKALDQLERAAGKDAAKAARETGLAGDDAPIDAPTLPNPNAYQPKDVFADCGAIDAKFYVQPMREAAMNTIGNCLAKVYPQKGAWSVGVMPTIITLNAEGRYATGIAITVSGQVPVGNTVFQDLRHSIEIRDGYLMTWPASVVDLNAVPKWPEKPADELPGSR